MNVMRFKGVNYTAFEVVKDIYYIQNKSIFVLVWEIIRIKLGKKVDIEYIKKFEV